MRFIGLSLVMIAAPLGAMPSVKRGAICAHECVISKALSPQDIEQIKGNEHHLDKKFVLSQSADAKALKTLIAAFPQMKHLELMRPMGIKDFSPLKKLVKLHSLRILTASIDDERLEFLQGLGQLKRLSIMNTKESNKIYDLIGLAKLSKLESLDLYGMNVKSLAPVGRLVHLVDLRLQNLNVKDYSPLASLVRLEQLSIGGSQMDSYGFLKPLSLVRSLRMFPKSSDQGLSKDHLKNLTKLETLRLGGGTGLEDLEFLPSMPSLSSLYLNGIALKDWSPLSDAKSLMTLDLKGSSLSDLKPLLTLKNLEHLSLEDTKVSDIKGLTALTQLTYLNLKGIPASLEVLGTSDQVEKAMRRQVLIRKEQISAALLQKLRSKHPGTRFHVTKY